MLHKEFWDAHKWGMNDDLISIGISQYLQSQSSRIKIEPWQVKGWTVQRGYTYRIRELMVRPVAVMRSGFMSIYNSIKGIK